jgi:hypothetical protein
MQAMIGQPLDPKFNIAPETTAEWKKRVDDAAAAKVAGLPRLREALGVAVEPTTWVKTFIVSRCRSCKAGPYCSKSSRTSIENGFKAAVTG